MLEILAAFLGAFVGSVLTAKLSLHQGQERALRIFKWEVTDIIEDLGRFAYSQRLTELIAHLDNALEKVRHEIPDETGIKLTLTVKTFKTTLDSLLTTEQPRMLLSEDWDTCRTELRKVLAVRLPTFCESLFYSGAQDDGH